MPPSPRNNRPARRRSAGSVLRRELPALLARLGQIPDPRQPKKCRHRLTVLLLYGLLMFVFQFASRRAVNRELTRPQFEANLRLLFPELETLPHADTLFRLLRDIDVAHLEQAHVDLVRRLIRAKTFRRHLINHASPIAIDGSQIDKLKEKGYGSSATHAALRAMPSARDVVGAKPKCACARAAG